MKGGGDRAGGYAGTPHGELARLRADRERQSSELRERIMEAMLASCGELGYRSVSVQDVIDRYDGYRVQFYRHFSSKAECYAAAYEFEAERRLARMVRAASAEAGWRPAMRAALREFADFVCEHRLMARGLLAEVHVAGGPAMSKRTEMLERLTVAIDEARHAPDSTHSPPPVTATFMVGAVESAVVSALVNDQPESFAAAVPELAQMIVAAYFGDEAADEELAALRAA